MSVRETSHRGHGVALVREAIAGGAKRVFAFGGDGTWHEAVGGYFAAGAPQDVVLAPIPGGSGCDFARHLKLPLEPGAAARSLSKAPVKRIDVVRADRPGLPSAFLTNMAGTGLAADANDLVDRWGKPLGGTASYLLAVVALLLLRPARSYRLVLDGADASGAYHAVILCNTETTGGGMRAAPGADLLDGKMDVLTVAKSGKVTLLRNLAKLYEGTHIEEPGVLLRRARRVEISAEDSEPAGLNFDGEPAGVLPASFEVIPGALPVLMPLS